MAGVVKITDLKRFYKTLKAVSELTLEPNAIVDEYGLRLVALDAANVFMFDAWLKGVTESERESEGWHSLNVTHLLQALSRLSKSYDEARLTFDSEAVLEAGSAVVRVPTYYSPVDEKGRVELPSLDKIESSGEVLLSAFERALGVGSINQDAVWISTDDGLLLFDGSSKQLGSSRDTAPCEGLVAGVRSSFAVEYLSKGLLSLAKLSGSDSVRVELGSDYPLRASCKGDYFELACVLAPRVEG